MESPKKNSRDLETFHCSPFVVAWKMLGLQIISSDFFNLSSAKKKPVTFEKQSNCEQRSFCSHSEFFMSLIIFQKKTKLYTF